VRRLTDTAILLFTWSLPQSRRHGTVDSHPEGLSIPTISREITHIKSVLNIMQVSGKPGRMPGG
jgi:hypothetical protein